MNQNMKALKLKAGSFEKVGSQLPKLRIRSPWSFEGNGGKMTFQSKLCWGNKYTT